MKVFYLLLLFSIILGVTSETVRKEISRRINDMHNIWTQNMKTVLIEGKIKDFFTCATCMGIVDSLTDLRKTNSSGTDVLTLTEFLCNRGVVDVLTPEACLSLVEQNIHQVLYVLDNVPPNQAKQMCGIVYQDKECGFKPNMWKVSINGEGNKTIKGKRGGKPLTILHLTDIHYDPQYLPGSNRNCQYAICCGRDDDDITSFADKAGYWADYSKCDLPIYMIQDLFKQLSRISEEFDIIYFTGDIISHRIWNTSVESNTKDIKLIMQLFREYFPNKPIFPILGNHEPSPLNLFVPKSLEDKPFSTQWLFDLIAEEWGLPEETKQTIRTGGYYKTNTKEGLCIIGLNSNTAYPLNFWLTFDDVDPYGQLQWLANTLQDAEERGETCHILTHVPSLNAHIPWASEYRRIIERYSHIVMGHFCGHTHLDELNIFYTTEAPQIPINVAWNGGSITTYDGVNPNFRIFQSDPGNFELLDYDEYIMDVKTSNHVPASSPTWFKFYSFKREYNVESLSPEDVANFVVRMTTNATMRFVYNKNKMRGSDTIVCDRKCEVKALRNMVTSVSSDTAMADYVEANMN